MTEIIPLVIPGTSDPDWRWRALCAEVDPELFFPKKGMPTAAARRVCAACEVRTECLTWALEHDQEHGVWGGLSDQERRRLKREAA